MEHIDSKDGLVKEGIPPDDWQQTAVGVEEAVLCKIIVLLENPLDEALRNNQYFRLNIVM